MAALALFAVPVTLLGTVSPFAIRLGLTTVERAGTVAGRLYALSTIGSIVGTFLAAIVAIPFVGTQRTLVATAVLLALAAGLLLGRRWQLVALALVALLAVPPGAIKAAQSILYEAESQYRYVDVRQRGDGARILELNEGVVATRSGIRTACSPAASGTCSSSSRRSSRTACATCSSSGTPAARPLGHLPPSTPAWTSTASSSTRRSPDAARRFLGLDRILACTSSRPTRARTSAAPRKRYDLIAIDTYRQPYIPFQVTTREFFRLVRAHLSPGGAVALNISRVPGDRGLLDAIAATVRAELGQAWAWDALRFNTLLFAFARPVTRPELVRRVGAVPPSCVRSCRSSGDGSRRRVSAATS